MEISIIANALINGLLLVIPLSLIGIIVILKRMSFIGAGLAHSSFAGVVISLILNIPVLIGTFLYNLLASLTVLKLKDFYDADALIGIIFSFSMALGILLAYVVGINTSIVQILFGDILTISKEQFIFSLLSFVLSLIVLFKYGKKLFYFAFDEEYLKAKGENTEFLYLILLVFLALLISISIKLIGILLVSSFLVLPASSAKLISKNAKTMALASVVYGVLSLLLGIGVSLIIDIPSSAMIVLASTAMFLITYLYKIKKGE